MTILLPRKWTKQPQQPVAIDWSSELNKNLLGAMNMGVVHTPTGIILPAYSSDSGLIATPSGVGVSIAANANSTRRFDDLPTTAAGDPFTLEFIVYASAFSSLAAIVTYTTSAYSDGNVSSSAFDGGNHRACMSYGGGTPQDIYAWNGANDFDGNTPFELNKLQHIFITKEPGTGAVQMTVYLNGVQVAQGNSTGGVPFLASGPCLYIGGKHHAGTTAITGAVVQASVSNRLVPAAEVLERSCNPWQIFKASPRRVWVSGVGGGSVSGVETAWRVANESAKATAWRTQAEAVREAAWRVLNESAKATAWRTQVEAAREAAWRVLNESAKATAWRTQAVFARDSTWRIATSLARLVSWRIGSTVLSPPSVVVYASPFTRLVYATSNSRLVYATSNSRLVYATSNSRLVYAQEQP